MRNRLLAIPFLLAIGCWVSAASGQDTIRYNVVRVPTRRLDRTQGFREVIEPADVERVLNENGRRGWDLVAIINSSNNPEFLNNPVLVFRDHNVRAREVRLAELETRLHEEIRTARQELLDTLKAGLAATLIGDYLEPLRQQVLADVERRLNQRATPTSPSP
jgi:Domain of unknown function (DUF4177)